MAWVEDGRRNHEIVGAGLNNTGISRRDFVQSIAAAGIAVAFGAPLGGVLFSLEAVSSFFPNRTMWRSFFCGISATLLIYYADPFSNGKLVNFEVRAT